MKFIKWFLKTVFIALFAIGSASIIGIVGYWIYYSISNKPSASTDIECFIDGKSVYTTRENCQALSVQKNQQPPRIINMPPPARMPTIDIKPPPKLEFPKVTRCDNQYDLMGNFTGVKCYESTL